MFSTTDTIVAIATPPGRGGIGIVRLSGDRAHAIALRLLCRGRPLEPRRATMGEVHVGVRPDGTTRSPASDQVLATYFPGPTSYTGEDVVEVSAHGSPVILRSIVETAMDAGARLAEPGEFTLRAYLSGRIDLPQAEAVADLIDAVTPLQARTAFDQLQGTLTRAISELDRLLFDLIARLEASVDFPDEGYHFVEPSEVAMEIGAIADRMHALLSGARRGRLVREGLHIAIVGPPNVGKSSLFNALVGTERAIVTEVPGTTRDMVSETIGLEGLRVTLVDTAGLRDGGDPIEAEGIARSKQAAQAADLVLVVGDPSHPPRSPGAEVDAKSVFVANKCDLAEAVAAGPDAVAVSALRGDGLKELKRRILEALEIEASNDPPDITNVRHIALVERAHDALCRAHNAALGEGRALPEEFVLADLQEARVALEEIAGRRAPADLIDHIFARFCIGK